MEPAAPALPAALRVPPAPQAAGPIVPSVAAGDEAAELPPPALVEGWRKLVGLIRQESPTLGNALARARLLPSPEGELVLGFPSSSAAADLVAERVAEVEGWTGRVLGRHVPIRMAPAVDPARPAHPSVFEEEERLRIELLEERRERARRHPLVQAVQLELEGTIQEIRPLDTKKE